VVEERLVLHPATASNRTHAWRESGWIVPSCWGMTLSLEDRLTAKNQDDFRRKQTIANSDRNGGE
jgi:hypothetical protein